jgi:hypothetical protein
MLSYVNTISSLRSDKTMLFPCFGEQRTHTTCLVKRGTGCIACLHSAIIPGMWKPRGHSAHLASQIFHLCYVCYLGQHPYKLELLQRMSLLVGSLRLMLYTTAKFKRTYVIPHTFVMPRLQKCLSETMTISTQRVCSVIMYVTLHI